MTNYATSHKIRYSIPSIQQQIEVSVVEAAHDIIDEDPATPDHADRLAWAVWANKNSSVAWNPFAWPVALNPAIQDSVAQDSSGQSVKDSDVQFVVNSVLPQVVADFIAKPPPGA